MGGAIDSTSVLKTRPAGPSADFAARLGHALAALDPAQRGRLEEAETSVTLRTTLGPGAVVLLDRHGPRIDETTATTEVHIELDLSVAASFLDGSIALACALMQGDARAWGPVRKYLGVDPIMRAALAGTADADRA